MNKVNLAVFPGTFDPPTLGHFDIIKRAARLFDQVIIGCADSPSKHTLFSLAERRQMLEQCCQPLRNVRVESFSGLLVDFLKEHQANVLVRGVRTVADYDYEIQLTGMYRTMMPGLEIVLLPTSGELAYISATLVREVLIHKGDIAPFVPAEVALLVRRLKEGA